MSKLNRKSIGLALPLAVVLMVIFLVIGLGIGYVAVPTHTTTETTTTTQSNANLVNYWAESTPWTFSEGGLLNSQLVPLLNSGNTSIYLLDVRMPADYATAHIAGAIDIPFPNITAALLAGTIPKNKIIIAICYTGNSAGVTAGLLVGLGYNAFDLWGGMAGWNNVTAMGGMYAMGVNYPVVTGSAVGTWTVWNPPA